ncbi:hypothetical protein ACVWZV_000933 [Bradyrhizobium sp. GM5.1]
MTKAETHRQCSTYSCVRQRGQSHLGYVAHKFLESFRLLMCVAELFSVDARRLLRFARSIQTVLRRHSIAFDRKVKNELVIGKIAARLANPCLHKSGEISCFRAEFHLDKRS